MLAGRKGIRDEGETMGSVRDGACRPFMHQYSPVGGNGVDSIAINEQEDKSACCLATRRDLVGSRLGPICDKCDLNSLEARAMLSKLDGCTGDYFELGSRRATN